ncbi:glycosyltransferase [Bradyrhizobium ottawaense]|uniref:glycosyltransferase n=1 Tax=Bradyrhizobium ottawaense TaxID=931866 RepID=UPI0027145C5B|nr:glycosyltransferase [Bradyrhizobium ottawaense]WLB50110.1 glycosyltransferase [Bradyrhizobium ottawaense]
MALVHYWLVGMRGGEKVLESLCELFPHADIFTLVADVTQLSPRIRQHKIRTSFLQKMGGVKHYQKMLPLMPFALESFDLTPYDLIISSEAGPAKGIVPRPDAVHVCYCHSPMRYIWDLEPQYRASAGYLPRFMMSAFGPLLRQWDVTTAARVDHFITNSSYVAKRVEKYYRRQAMVINPPVATERFRPTDELEDSYLCAGQITPYKKIELAVEAFTRMGKKLDVVGTGASPQLRGMAGPTIRFLGALDDESMASKFARCKALIYPGVEDFGIIPVEVMASGRPVLAYGQGGATETVVDGKTGLLFKEQTADAIIETVQRFEELGVSGTTAEFMHHAARFNRDAFKTKMRDFIGSVI